MSNRIFNIPSTRYNLSIYKKIASVDTEDKDYIGELSIALERQGYLVEVKDNAIDVSVDNGPEVSTTRLVPVNG